MGAEAAGQRRISYCCGAGCLGGCGEVRYASESDRACKLCVLSCAWPVEPNGDYVTVEGDRLCVTSMS